MTCDSPSFIYPLLADIYYPMVEQGAYGNVKKKWVLDRTISVALNPAGRKFKQDVQPEVNITIDNSLVGSTKADLTQSAGDNLYSITNIILTNIRDRNGNIVYNESAGVRAGKATIFELSTFNPIIGPFGTTEYYKIVVARSENQGAEI